MKRSILTGPTVVVREHRQRTPRIAIFNETLI
jgi:hypothetical protein